MIHDASIIQLLPHVNFLHFNYFHTYIVQTRKCVLGVFRSRKVS